MGQFFISFVYEQGRQLKQKQKATQRNEWFQRLQLQNTLKKLILFSLPYTSRCQNLHLISGFKGDFMSTHNLFSYSLPRRA